EQTYSSIHHEKVERTAFAHSRNHCITVRAVRQDCRAPRLGRQPLCRLAGPGIGKGYTRTLGRQTPYDRCTDASATTEHQNGLTFKCGHRALLAIKCSMRYING